MGLTLQQQNDIMRLFRKFGSAAAVSREISVSVESVKKILRKRGYELKRGGRRVASNGGRAALSENEIRKVIGSYRSFHGCAGCASRGSYTREVFNNYWYLAGLPRISHDVAHFDPVNVTDRHLERAYRQCQRMLDGSIETPIPIIRIKETKVKEETKPLGKRIDRRYRGGDTKFEIISAYTRYESNPRLAAQSMHYGIETIRKCWAEFKKEARESYTLYRGNPTRTAKELGYPEREILRVWSDLGLSFGKTSGLEQRVD